jgi:hypothetical protein
MTSNAYDGPIAAYYGGCVSSRSANYTRAYYLTAYIKEDTVFPFLIVI